jgi:hypothetical protein
MFIFVDPSELRQNSLFPNRIDTIPCPSLEAVTGADFVISRIPVSPVTTLSLHIKSKSLFCQRKSGYDAIGDFNQIWLEIGRMKQIPMQQCFILPIGKFYGDAEGLLRIEGKKPLKNAERITYLTYLKNEAEWGYSGVQVRRLNNEDELELFIEAQFDELQRIENRQGKKEIFTKGISTFPADDPFQEVSKIDDWRTPFLTGFPGIGIKTLENIAEYLKDDFVSFVRAIQVIVNTDSESKPLHKILGIGDKTRQEVKRLLGLKDNHNILVRDNDPLTDFQAGWNSALDGFMVLVKEKGVNPQKAWKQMREEEIPF